MLCYVMLFGISLPSVVCVRTKTSKLHKSSVGQSLKIFCFNLKHRNSQQRISTGTDLVSPVTSETLLPVTLVKQLKDIRKSPGEPNSDVAGFNNGSLIT